MNHNRIDKLIQEARTLQVVAKQNADPYSAWWLDDAIARRDRATERLDEMCERELWSDELIEVLLDVFLEQWTWVCASLGSATLRARKPENMIHWFDLFPDWFALIPADLQLAAMRHMNRENGYDSMLNLWLLALGWRHVSIPEGLTQEAMGAVIRAVVENADNLNRMLAYCKKCQLIYPTGAESHSSILPNCPHCGEKKISWNTDAFTRRD